MTDQERFTILGNKRAEHIHTVYGIPLNDALRCECYRFEALWNRANCSDDYAKTLREQDALIEHLNAYIKGCRDNL